LGKDHKNTVTQWLGEKVGWKGPFWGTLLGALVSGGPFFFYPLMATLSVSGANIGTQENIERGESSPRYISTGAGKGTRTPNMRITIPLLDFCLFS